MRSLTMLPCALLLAGCPNDPSTGDDGTGSTSAAASSTTTSPPGDGTSSTTLATDSSTTVDPTGEVCAVAYEECDPPSCCEGFVCVQSSDLSYYCCAEGDGNCYCACTNSEPLEPVPPACAELDVPPFEGMEYAAWRLEPSTIRATPLADYACSMDELRSTSLPCPCTGTGVLHQLELAALPDAAGPTTATWSFTERACRDVCSEMGEPFGYPDTPVEIIAVSETCIIGEMTTFSYDLRFYADLTACG